MTAWRLGAWWLPGNSVPLGQWPEGISAFSQMRGANPWRLSAWEVSLGKGNIMKTFIIMLRDEAGASAAEYALILAIIGATIALAAVTLGGSISNAMGRASNCINAGSSASTTTCK